MPIIADIIIIAVLILALVIGVKRGLLGAIAGIVSVVAAFFGAALSASFLTPTVEQWLQPILMQKLEKEGILYLEQSGGRTKNACLTETGQDYVNRTIAQLFSAECSAFQGWTEEEIHQHLRLMEKYNACFREQIEKM